MLTGRIGKFTSRCKRWTDWNWVAGKIKNVGCRCKRTESLREDSEKSQRRMKLDIEAISRILDSTGASGSTPEDHVKWIEGKIRNEGLPQFNIKVSIDNYELHNLANYSYPIITINFQKIDFDICDSFGIEIPAYSYPDGSSGIELSFSSCNLRNSGNSFSKIDWLPDGNSSLCFKNCKFEDIYMLIMFDLSSSSDIFLSSCEMINGETVFREGDLADVKKDSIAKSMDQKFHDVHIFKPESRSKDDMNQEKLPSITIVNSKIDNLRLIGRINSFFRNKNIFKALRSGEYRFDRFYWGGYQKFSTSDDEIFLNQKFFLDLNANEEIQNNNFQILIIQRELAKCYHAILRSEGKVSWQDRVLFRFSQYVSNHGTSWLRAARVFSIDFNLLIVFPIISTASICINNSFESYIGFINAWYDSWISTRGLNAYGRLFNPLELASQIFFVKNEWWTPFFDGAHKIIYALLSYELVKTLRRFGRSNATPPRS